MVVIACLILRVDLHNWSLLSWICVQYVIFEVGINFMLNCLITVDINWRRLWKGEWVLTFTNLCEVIKWTYMYKHVNHEKLNDSGFPQGLALSIGPNWVGFTWGQRQNPVSETLCFEKLIGRSLDKDKTMDNVQKHNICTNELEAMHLRWYVWTRKQATLF
jgi:hypothetical protein